MTSLAQQRPEKFRIGRVFSNSFAVIGRNLGFLAVVVGLFSTLPALLYNLWNLSRVAAMVDAGGAGNAFETSAMESYSAVSVIASLIIFVLALLVQAALVRGAIEDLNGKRPVIGDCIQIALRSFFPTLGIGILVILVLVVGVFVMVFMAWAIPLLGWLIGLALALIPAFMWLISVSVSVPIAVQERLGVFGSISRSRALTKGSRWSIFWLLLIIGDRVDVLGSRVEALMKGQPDNAITETGVLAEFKHSAFRTRFGQHRADLKHQPLDLLLWAAPYLAIAGGVYMLAHGRSTRRAR